MSDASLPASQPARHFGRDASLTALVTFEALAIFVVGPLIGLHDAAAHVFALTFTLLVVAGIFAVSRSTWGGLAVIGTGLLILPLQLLSFYWSDHYLIIVYVLLFIVFFVLLSGLILLHVFRRSRINLHCILGAIAVYLHIGLIFALFNTLLARLIPGAFTMTDALTQEHTGLFAKMVYYSFTTLTSVGFGDITPDHPLTQSVANLEAMTGQLFPAILLARLVSMEIESSRKKGK